MSRRTLTDAQWTRIEHLLPGKPGDRGRSGTDDRLFIDANLWLARGATPWRPPSRACLHAREGAIAGQLADHLFAFPALDDGWRLGMPRIRKRSSESISRRHVFKALSQEPDFEYVLVDATICKAHAPSR